MVPIDLRDQFKMLLHQATASYADSLMLTMKARTERALLEEFAKVNGIPSTFGIYYAALKLAKERVGIYAGQGPKTTKVDITDPADLGHRELRGKGKRTLK